ncbi:MAG: glutamyl-tRNA(Gln) amidotransferase subunit E [Cenarchaeum symbiont of Oopsacas minuta]|nr:glutamyl-tRNA(Gln) amidotransferase subunit E [Cenarchaeum symbiont of Oopsacas minuta]
MDKLDYTAIEIKVGLEIHQQLYTGRKLFCKCSQMEYDGHVEQFSRKLRISKSELGEYDPAAIFESGKEKVITYFANPKNSCLVERDEEPPCEVDMEAKKTVFIIAAALKSNIFAEIFPMRKMVIDGSNTSGFQRTMLISQGGKIDVSGRTVGVQTIYLEEDAAKLLEDKDGIRKYGLERLGIPLIEIALDPISAEPHQIREIALYLGRLLRSTRRVARGLGTIRQDVNVSIRDGPIVEIKGVQQLEQLEKTIEYEAMRQDGLCKIAKKLSDSKCSTIDSKAIDVTEYMSGCTSKLVQKMLQNGDKIVAIKFPKYSGMFGYSPYKGIRLGAEIAQRVKSYGIGGVFHSDELPNYGIEQTDVEIILSKIDADVSDGFILVASPPLKMDIIVSQIISRVNLAFDGVIAETRLSMQDGRTIFLRPRPGSSRMYPETDVPSIVVTSLDLEYAQNCIPKPWDKALDEFGKKYGLNLQLAEQIFSSEYFETFEKICTRHDTLSANFVASSLCSTITSLQRSGMDVSNLGVESIMEVFEILDTGKISKESVEIIFSDLMSGKYSSVQNAVKDITADSISDDEVSMILDALLLENTAIIDKQGMRALNPLMGIAMKKMRGKTSGQMINKLLNKKLQSRCNKKNL